MRLQVFHRTHYRYASPVRQNINEARLQPVEDAHQRRHGFQLGIQPFAEAHQQTDFYGNHVHFFEVSMPHQELLVEARSLVETRDKPHLEADAHPASMESLVEETLRPELFDFVYPSLFVNFDSDNVQQARDILGEEKDAWQFARAVMNRVHGLFRYQPAVTNVHTTMQQALRLKQGVCQDFAHVMLGLCRAQGLPARYVSGYIYNGPADQLKGAQATHAWVEVWIPGFNWVGLDPTNNHPADGRYVKAATGRDYGDVAPLKGTYRGTSERSLLVEVLVSQA